MGLPVKDEVSVNHPKVQEIRSLSEWSDAHFCTSPEQHGAVTAVFKNQSMSNFVQSWVILLSISRLDPVIHWIREANTGQMRCFCSSQYNDFFIYNEC